MKSIPNLSLKQIYPPAGGEINLNTCHDPDCGNHGVDAIFSARPPGSATSLSQPARARSNSTAVGLGKYKLTTTSEEDRRVSTAFEYTGDPHSWTDKRTLECQFDAGSGPCQTRFEVLSNEPLFEEAARLRTANGVFSGPACAACGRDYLDAPDEFVLDGAEVASSRREPCSSADGETQPPKAARPDRVRLIHKPCRGNPGARISATLDHRRQRRTADNVAILQALVNGAGITKLMRMMAPSGSGRTCGAKRVYDRIFWLERTLLAFERVQLSRWKAEREASGEDIGHHLAHDDIVLMSGDTTDWPSGDMRNWPPR